MATVVSEIYSLATPQKMCVGGGAAPLSCLASSGIPVSSMLYMQYGLPTSRLWQIIPKKSPIYYFILLFSDIEPIIL